MECGACQSKCMFRILSEMVGLVIMWSMGFKEGKKSSEHITPIQEAEKKKRTERGRAPPNRGQRTARECLPAPGPAAPAIFGVSLLEAMPLQDSPREFLGISTHFLSSKWLQEAFHSDGICVCIWI